MCLAAWRKEGGQGEGGVGLGLGCMSMLRLEAEYQQAVSSALAVLVSCVSCEVLCLVL